jgi:uncharacterized membrane protein YheB (UPF0754 family)
MTHRQTSSEPLGPKPISESSREYGKKLFKLFTEIGKKYPFFDTSTAKEYERPKLNGNQKKIFLIFLQTLPSFLFFAFLLSFYWDFDGVQYTYFQLNIAFEGFLRIVSVSGLIGFGTNWLAITMLFKPEKKRPLLGHGLIPSQKEIIAYRLAQAISTDLINPEIIQKKIFESQLIPFYTNKSIKYAKSIVDDEDFRLELKQLTTDYIREVVSNPELRSNLAKTIINSLEESIKSNKLEQIALQTYLFIRGKEAQQIVEQAINKIPDNIDKLLEKVDDFVDSIPNRLEDTSTEVEKIVTKLLNQLINQLDVHQVIEENIRTFEEQRLEKMIKSATNNQLRYIQYLGALLGSVGGLVIWSPLLAIAILGSLGILFISLDTLLFRKLQKSA